MKRIIPLMLCLALCFSLMSLPAAAADAPVEETLAYSLKQMGLFKGVSDDDLGLEGKPTRTEAVVMLVRLLGQEEKALSGGYSHPFDDVEEWADGYVAFAYEEGLAAGVSESRFGSGDASCEMYLTYMLRALGYEDGSDFDWQSPYLLAAQSGLVPNELNTGDFRRSDVVLVSYAALAANMKDSETTLAQALIDEGTLSSETFEEVYDRDILSLSDGSALGVGLYYACAPATFLLSVYNSNGTLVSTGSGFFIDSDGTAVTNYHVVEGAYTAVATLHDGTNCEISGVYDYDEKEDWAVISVSGSGFTYLETETAVSEGERVFAIGSPLGLSTSITEGVISSSSRTVKWVNYIQTSAAISPGSSGGALVNDSGKVVGITTGAYLEGNNMNLALPISCIEGYSREELESFSSLRGELDGTAIQGYDRYDGVPDFGVYMNVNPRVENSNESGGITYYYSHEALQNAGMYDSAVSRYTSLLREWGFYALSYYVGEEGLTQVFYCEIAPYDYIVTLTPTDTLDGEAFVSVSVSRSEIEEPEPYDFDSLVIDFGDLFGIEPVSEGRIGNSYYYEYDGVDIYYAGYQDWYAGIYDVYLGYGGYDLEDSYSTLSVVYYLYKNSKTGYSVEVTQYQPDYFGNIIIMIHEP